MLRRCSTNAQNCDGGKADPPLRAVGLHQLASRMHSPDISLAVACVPWYVRAMSKLACIINFNRMTRFGRAVEGVAR